MREGSVILTPVLQADGQAKNRPAVILREMPPHADFLVCGITTQLHHYVGGFDEIISPTDPDFEASGLRQESLVRLGFLAMVPHHRVLGLIGEILSERHSRLLKKLSDYLISDLS